MNQLVISLLAMSIELSFVPAGRAREGEVGGFWAEIASWLLLGLAVESHWLALGEPFLSSFAQMGLENSVLAVQGFHFISEHLFCSVVVTTGH